MKEEGFLNYRKYGATPQLNFIVDLEGFGWHVLPDLKFVKKVLDIFQDNYPETLYRAILIRSPFVFYMAWKIISPWLDKRVSFFHIYKISFCI